MRKIISLFQRNYESDHLVRNEVVPGAEWVLVGEGIATRKFDGTACMVRDGKLYRRYELKKDRLAPVGFEPSQEPDPVTDDIPGWVPVNDASSDKWHRQAYMTWTDWPDGTYELVGPKVQGNPEGFGGHTLIPHGRDTLRDAPRDFEGIQAYLSTHNIEGIVWWHPDGRMVKIKAKDFGLRRGGHEA